jgi:hypothetical protein
MWYKVKRICIEKWKNVYFVVNLFYLNNNKKFLIGYKVRIFVVEYLCVV